MTASPLRRRRLRLSVYRRASAINPNKFFPLFRQRPEPTVHKGRGTAEGGEKTAMRLFLIMWFVPLSLTGIWYGLAANDISFGTLIFSREMHDKVFGIYASVLGVEPEVLPPMLAKALILDTFLVLGIAAFRWRKHWWPQTRAWFAGQFGQKGPDLVNESDAANQQPTAG